MKDHLALIRGLLFIMHGCVIFSWRYRAFERSYQVQSACLFTHMEQRSTYVLRCRGVAGSFHVSLCDQDVPRFTVCSDPSCACWFLQALRPQPARRRVLHRRRQLLPVGAVPLAPLPLLLLVAAVAAAAAAAAAPQARLRAAVVVHQALPLREVWLCFDLVRSRAATLSHMPTTC